MGKRLLVIGDTIIDEYVDLKAIGLSLESPTIKTEPLESKIVFGGAANVAKFARKFGMDVDFITCMSKDSEELFSSRFDVDLLNANYTVENRKTRFYVQHGDERYKHLQINKVNKLSMNVKWNFSLYDIIAFSDYRCGLIQSPVIRRAANSHCETFGASQMSDKESNLAQYIDLDYIVCNKYESQFLERRNNVIITNGSKGSQLNGVHYEPKAVDNVKSTIGAGDCFYAAFLAYRDLKKANEIAGDYIEGKYEF